MLHYGVLPSATSGHRLRPPPSSLLQPLPLLHSNPSLSSRFSPFPSDAIHLGRRCRSPQNRERFISVESQLNIKQPTSQPPSAVGKMNLETSSSTCGSSIPTEDDRTPLWKYASKLEKAEGGGNCKFQCNYCHAIFKGSYSRVKAHLLKIPGHGIKSCTKVTAQNLVEMQNIVEAAELRSKNAMSRRVPFPSCSVQPNASLGTNTGPLTMEMLDIEPLKQEAFEVRKRQTVRNTDMEEILNYDAREQLNSELARMFYSAGLPFQLARNPYYISSFSLAANSAICGYVPPSYKMLRTTLLQKEKANIERMLEPIKSTWKEKGISIVTDGWSDAQRKPLINFMAVTESRTTFLKAIDRRDRVEDKFFVAKLIKEVIAEVGPKHAVQVITNDTPVCRAAGLLIEAQFPHIFWTPCIVHSLDLALKKICSTENIEANETTCTDEFSWIRIVVRDAVMIKNFIVNHSMRLSIFNQFANLKMLAVAETRFASAVVMLKRLESMKCGLRSMVNSNLWDFYKEDDVKRAKFVKENVLNDSWWNKVNYIISFTEPICEMLRIADSDKPCLHLIYDLWDSMIERIKMAIYQNEDKHENEKLTLYSLVHNILKDHWNKSKTSLHCLAHSLNPRYYSAMWSEEFPTRLPPHRNSEVSTERNKCMKRYFPDADERRVVNVEFGKFALLMDEFAKPDSLTDRGYMDPKVWWVVYGSSVPKLQALAIKLLGQPCSSSCCERNWSTFSFMNSLNKMKPQLAEDLVFVHTNLRLLSRRNPQYMQGENKMWDVGGDAFDSLESVGLLEIADLSLDEPDLEAVLFTDEGKCDDDELIEDGSN